MKRALKYGALLLSGIWALPAYAAPQLEKTDISGCGKLDILTSYTISAPTYEEAQYKFDQKMLKLKGFVASQNIKQFEVAAFSYTVRLQGGSGNGNSNALAKYKPAINAASAGIKSYQLAGSNEYQVGDSDSAFKLGQFLTQEKFEVTVSNKTGKNNLCGSSGATGSAVPVNPTVNQVLRAAAPATPNVDPSSSVDVGTVVNQAIDGQPVDPQTGAPVVVQPIAPSLPQ